MKPSMAEQDNRPVWDGHRRGHYEVWYLKLNLVEQQLAFWLRYTITAPRQHLGDPVAELWAIAFDGRDPGRHEAYKEGFAPSPASLADEHDRRILRVGAAELTHDGCRGSLGDGGLARGISWELAFAGEGEPLRHFPHEALYRLPLPRTKLCAPRLSMTVQGTIRWRGEEHRFSGVHGHQAHIWGSQHAEEWAWANCTDFPGAPGAVLEALTARIALGPVVSPRLTLAVLRLDGREHRFDAMAGWLTQRSRYDLEGWHLVASQDGSRIEVRIRNRLEQTVGVTYRDPDASTRVCHNSKLADVTVDLFRRSFGLWWHERRLESQGRTAFEVVRRAADPRVRLLLP
ncbi:MAG: hypothetical protein FJ125_06360 [Deltaproteobacteria bacterium]|nr:hypothetical protein [Deltaproteobacteria bacterium]